MAKKTWYNRDMNGNKSDSFVNKSYFLTMFVSPVRGAVQNKYGQEVAFL